MTDYEQLLIELKMEFDSGNISEEEYRFRKYDILGKMRPESYNTKSSNKIITDNDFTPEIIEDNERRIVTHNKKSFPVVLIIILIFAFLIIAFVGINAILYSTHSKEVEAARCLRTINKVSTIADIDIIPQFIAYQDECKACVIGYTTRQYNGVNQIYVNMKTMCFIEDVWIGDGKDGGAAPTPELQETNNLLAAFFIEGALRYWISNESDEISATIPFDGDKYGEFDLLNKPLTEYFSIMPFIN